MMHVVLLLVIIKLVGILTYILQISVVDSPTISNSLKFARL